MLERTDATVAEPAALLPDVAAPERARGAAYSFEVPENPPRVEDLDAALPGVADYFKVLIARGDDPNDVTITVNCLAPDAADPDGLASNGIYVSNPSGAPRVTVSANVEYPSLFGALGFDTSAARLKSVAVSAVMGI